MEKEDNSLKDKWLKWNADDGKKKSSKKHALKKKSQIIAKRKLEQKE